jgi:1,4-dihydroxy-2-naphthoate octaprenyltransferase
MTELSRRIGLGLAARGEISDAVRWSAAAADRGLESVWVHDSYFERDAVTYASAIASQVGGVRVGLGALNPYTRHPVVLAMTVSALDAMAPGRISLALGSALPLRLAQMGIPYSSTQAPERVARAIEDLRTLWRGERLPPAAEGVPPLQPMFPPVHDVPIFLAGYRTPMVELAGRKADGYLSRPAESLPGLEKIVTTLRRSAVAAGRAPDAVETAGYLLTLVADTRREALNRAKREPFVIYMMSILSDVTLRRAGFETGMRDRIAAAWRVEDYHRAAEMIPDELLDAFILCGTVDQVAERAGHYHAAGLEVPLLQPIVQEDAQVEACLAAAVAYGSLREAVALMPATSAPGTRSTSTPGWLEIVRPFSFTASVVPVATGGALALLHQRFSPGLFVLALLASVLLQAGTNIINEIYDVRQGIDSIVSPRASHAIVKGRIAERLAFGLAFLAFTAAALLGVTLALERGWPVIALGIVGLVGGFGYTAPPLQYKFRALGPPLVFCLMGPLMVIGTYYVVSGRFGWDAVVASIPVGLLVTAILHGNEWRDISEDARAGISTLSIRFGRRAAHLGYVALVLGAYLALATGVMLQVLPTGSLLAMLSLPLLVTILRNSELGSAGSQRAIAKIDLQTAQLHATFGGLLVAGLVLAGVLP